MERIETVGSGPGVPVNAARPFRTVKTQHLPFGERTPYVISSSPGKGDQQLCETTPWRSQGREAVAI